MPPNCSGFYKEGKVTISAGLRNFHYDVRVKDRKTALFTSNTIAENKSSKGESMRHEISDGVNAADRASACEYFRETVKPLRPQTYYFNKK